MTFLFFFTHSGRSLPGGLAEGQLAVILLLFLQSGPRGSDWGGKLGLVGELEWPTEPAEQAGFDARQLSEPLQALIRYRELFLRRRRV